ncbi:hypothetical protein GCM10007172_30270 [Sinomonas atrocyanea]|nr:hypothetical protein GCM10007172_30270 [Sinomonas atrocyanea]
MGPRAMLIPMTPAQMPIARERALGSWKVLRRIETATGFSIAPPKAWMTRAAIRKPSDGATAQSTEPRVKTAMPRRKMRRRPKRSAMEPAIRSRAAITRV